MQLVGSLFKPGLKTINTWEFVRITRIACFRLSSIKMGFVIS